MITSLVLFYIFKFPKYLWIWLSLWTMENLAHSFCNLGQLQTKQTMIEPGSSEFDVIEKAFHWDTRKMQRRLCRLVITFQLSLLPLLPTPSQCQYQIQRTDPLAHLTKTLSTLHSHAYDGEVIRMECPLDTQVWLKII